MHKFYSYFLIDKDVKIEIEPSKNRFDFGIHRVQKSLNEHNAVKYLEVQIQDFTGVQDSAGVLAITERDIKRAVDALFEEKEKLEERLNLAIKERDIKRAKVLKEKIRKIDSEARELWKKIQKEAEEL